MSGFTGKTEQMSGTPEEVLGLRQWLAQMLQQEGGQGLFSQGDSEDILAPYRELFEQENMRTFAQAKESAGNLTGSGYGKIMARGAANASTQQGGFLANLLEQRRTGDANRMAALLQTMSSAGVGSPQYAYQPGFIDYLAEGIKEGAKAKAMGGEGSTFNIGGGGGMS